MTDYGSVAKGEEPVAKSRADVRDGYIAQIGIVLPFALFTLAAALFVYRYSHNWPRQDDFFLVEFYRRICVIHNFSLKDFFLLRDGARPEGVLTLLPALIFGVKGADFLTPIWLGFFSIFGATTLTVAIASSCLKKPISKAIVWIAVPMAMYHPIQEDLLLQSNSVGWFLANDFTR